ncbi:MAG: hypothetical protein QW412_01220 [Candidatus Aenigmatarchaeota archaeon]
MKALIILFVFLFLLILYIFSSYTVLFSKTIKNETIPFYLVGKVRMEKGKIFILNVSID